MIGFCVFMYIGDYRDVDDGGMQELVHGDEVEEGPSIHSVQD